MISLVFLLLLPSASVDAPQAYALKGVVTDSRSHEALFGATISLPNGKRLAVTDKKGRFQIDLPEVGWPSALGIAAPGHASQNVPLPHIPVDWDLATIALSVEARLRVRLLSVFASDKLRWRLLRLMGGKPVELLKEGSFPSGKSETTIDGLPTANCLLLLRSGGPLQQKVVITSTIEGQTTDLPVAITPTVLKLTVQAGGRRQAGAVVQFTQHDLRWSGSVFCDEHGAASEEMWESGEYFVGVRDQGRAGFTRVANLQSDTGTVSWTFEIPAHRVMGRVIDSVTGEPLRDVTLTLTGTAPREGGLEGLEASTDEAGRFEFRGVQEGAHSLRPYRKGYRYDRPQHFEIKKDDEDFETEILLEEIVDAHALIVIDAGGEPVASAAVFFTAGGETQPLEHTDDAGRVVLPPHRAGVVFAIPPAGSFAFQRIPTDLSGDVTLRVPPPSGSIEVISQDTDGHPIPQVFMMIRVNGTVIPPEVFGYFVARHGLSLRTDASGHARLQFLPPGLYDVWPVRSNGDVTALPSGNPPQPAGSVNVGSVPQVVTMTFKRKPSA